MGNPLLPALPILPSLGGFENAPDASEAPSTASSILGTVLGEGAKAAVGAATNNLFSGLFGGVNLDRIIAILLGLMLIGAGLFLFKPVSENITRVAEGAIAP